METNIGGAVRGDVSGPSFEGRAGETWPGFFAPQIRHRFAFGATWVKSAIVAFIEPAIAFGHLVGLAPALVKSATVSVLDASLSRPLKPVCIAR
jgi:hypothetical protein